MSIDTRLSPSERMEYRTGAWCGVYGRHGTRYAYAKGCRCIECRAANRDYQRTLRGAQDVIDPVPFTALLLALVHTHGFSVTELAERTHLAPGTIYAVLMGRSVRLTVHTAEALRGLTSLLPERASA